MKSATFCSRASDVVWAFLLTRCLHLVSYLTLPEVDSHVTMLHNDINRQNGFLKIPTVNVIVGPFQLIIKYAKILVGWMA